MPWSLFFLLKPPPWNLHSPGNDKSVKDVYEDKLDTVVQPEDSVGGQVERQAGEGQDGDVSRTEPPGEQVDEVLHEGDVP